jgi:hypothetical protein
MVTGRPSPSQSVWSRGLVLSGRFRCAVGCWPTDGVRGLGPPAVTKASPRAATASPSATTQRLRRTRLELSDGGPERYSPLPTDSRKRPGSAGPPRRGAGRVGGSSSTGVPDRLENRFDSVSTLLGRYARGDSLKKPAVWGSRSWPEPSWPEPSWRRPWPGPVSSSSSSAPSWRHPWRRRASGERPRWPGAPP